MIHIIKEGQYKKIGLNLHRSSGGFVAYWVWYTPATHELHGWRFRLRMHKKPHIIWSVERWNVIDSYLRSNDLELVNRETLVDLKELQESQRRRNERYAYIKP